MRGTETIDAWNARGQFVLTARGPVAFPPLTSSIWIETLNALALINWSAGHLGKLLLFGRLIEANSGAMGSIS